MNIVLPICDSIFSCLLYVGNSSDFAIVVLIDDYYYLLLSYCMVGLVVFLGKHKCR